MTSRIAAMSVDGTPISDADMARMRAEEELHAGYARRTARVVASASQDTDDCRMLLSMLGLGDDVVAAARADRPHVGSRKRRARAA
jgi:hypothetical protein